MSGSKKDGASSHSSTSKTTDASNDEIRKKKRTENVRRFREKRQAQQKSLQEKFSENEQKIADLEKGKPDCKMN